MQTTIKGQVEQVKLPPRGRGWGVITLLVGSANERASVTGHPLGIEVGDTIECVGQWENHPRFGKQFAARELRTLVPSDASGVIAWMLARLPAIGRKLATALVEEHGIPGVWDVLEHHPEKLAAMRGITPERARKIHERYVQLLPERDRVVQLKGYGLTDRQIARLTEAFGERVVDELRRDPYQLIERVDGFGWARADELAMRMGLPADHPSRIRAGIAHVLEEARAAGHCFVPAGKLIAMSARMLGVGDAQVVREGRELIAAGKLAQREGAARGGGPGAGAGSGGAAARTAGAAGGTVARVYLSAVDEAEQAVARAVLRLVGRSGGAMERERVAAGEAA